MHPHMTWSNPCILKRSKNEVSIVLESQQKGSTSDCSISLCEHLFPESGRFGVVSSIHQLPVRPFGLHVEACMLSIHQSTGGIRAPVVNLRHHVVDGGRATRGVDQVDVLPYPVSEGCSTFLVCICVRSPIPTSR